MAARIKASPNPCRAGYVQASVAVNEELCQACEREMQPLSKGPTSNRAWVAYVLLLSTAAALMQWPAAL